MLLHPQIKLIPVAIIWLSIPDFNYLNSVPWTGPSMFLSWMQCLSAWLQIWVCGWGGANGFILLSTHRTDGLQCLISGTNTKPSNPNLEQCGPGRLALFQGQLVCHLLCLKTVLVPSDNPLSLCFEESTIECFEWNQTIKCITALIIIQIRMYLGFSLLS